MPSKLVVKTDITDWRDECLRQEPTIETDDDLVRLTAKEGYSTAKVGRWAIVMRELEQAPDDIIKPNKLLMQAGARAEVATKVSSRKTWVEMPSGVRVEVRDHIGRPHRGEGEPTGEKENGDNALTFEAGVEAVIPQSTPEPPYVPGGSEAALRRATNYLENIVPGHIFERLKDIAFAGGDVEVAADALKDEIDRQVLRLTEPRPR